MGVYEKLLRVQVELKAPKNQYNSFGRYNYRSCEDILEGVKPLLDKNKATILISDDVVTMGVKNYIKATITFVDVETGEAITNSALAREAVEKKGMDDSQITGTASSYARKYALNGLFCIDDTKDSDTNAFKRQTQFCEPQQEVFCEPQQEIFCKLCSGKILPMRSSKTGQLVTAEQFAMQSDGLCQKCYGGMKI